MTKEMTDTRSGYEAAEALDKVISEILGENPISAGNLRAWMVFERTLRASLDILESEIQHQLNCRAMVKFQDFAEDPDDPDSSNSPNFGGSNGRH